MPGSKDKNAGKVLMDETEYLTHQRFFSACQRLEEAAVDTLSRYGGFVPLTSLQQAVEGMTKVRGEVHDSIGSRYGWDDDT